MGMRAEDEQICGFQPGLAMSLAVPFGTDVTGKRTKMGE